MSRPLLPGPLVEMSSELRGLASELRKYASRAIRLADAAEVRSEILRQAHLRLYCLREKNVFNRRRFENDVSVIRILRLVGSGKKCIDEIMAQGSRQIGIALARFSVEEWLGFDKVTRNVLLARIRQEGFGGINGFVLNTLCTLLEPIAGPFCTIVE